MTHEPSYLVDIAPPIVPRMNRFEGVNVIETRHAVERFLAGFDRMRLASG